MGKKVRGEKRGRKVGPFLLLTFIISLWPLARLYFYVVNNNSELQWRISFPTGRGTTYTCVSVSTTTSISSQLPLETVPNAPNASNGIKVGNHILGGIAYINLRHRQARRAAFIAQAAAARGMFAHVLEHIVAVDGRHLPLNELVRSGRLTKAAYESALTPRIVLGHHMTVGALGTVLSQARAWRLSLRHGAPILVFEDDVMLLGRAGMFEVRLAAALKAVPADDFDLFLLADLAKVQPRSAYATAISQFTEKVFGEFWGLYGYIIHPRAARKFLDSLYPIDVQADSYILSNSARWQLAVYRSTKDLVWTNNSNVRDSDVQISAAAIKTVAATHDFVSTDVPLRITCVIFPGGTKSDVAAACPCITMAPPGWLAARTCSTVLAASLGFGNNSLAAPGKNSSELFELVSANSRGLPLVIRSDVDAASAILCLASVYLYGGTCLATSTRILRDFAQLIAGTSLTLASGYDGHILPDIVIGTAGSTMAQIALAASLRATTIARTSDSSWPSIRLAINAAVIEGYNGSARILSPHLFDPMPIFAPPPQPHAQFDSYAVGKSVRPSSALHSGTATPRILHLAWLGAEPVPSFTAQLMRDCARRNPRWAVRLWTDADLDIDDRALRGLRRLPHFIAAQRLRFLAIWRQGGVFLEAGVECVQSLSSLVDAWPAALFQASTEKLSSRAAVIPGELVHPTLSMRAFAFPKQHPVAFKASTLAADKVFSGSSLPNDFLSQAVGSDLDKVRVFDTEALIDIH